ncbi:hypothetical protein SAMD00019534_112000, partial [Acytostelium subglobosum LB1]|uniref:hypothetical protein n=1 Tax=Acytostelium subglobosum LB1 TaxID=1410327 RepID=UPI000644D1DC
MEPQQFQPPQHTPPQPPQQQQHYQPDHQQQQPQQGQQGQQGQQYDKYQHQQPLQNSPTSGNYGRDQQHQQPQQQQSGDRDAKGSSSWDQRSREQHSGSGKRTSTSPNTIRVHYRKDLTAKIPYEVGEYYRDLVITINEHFGFMKLGRLKFKDINGHKIKMDQKIPDPPDLFVTQRTVRVYKGDNDHDDHPLGIFQQGSTWGEMSQHFNIVSGNLRQKNDKNKPLAVPPFIGGKYTLVTPARRYLHFLVKYQYLLEDIIFLPDQSHNTNTHPHINIHIHIHINQYIQRPGGAILDTIR